MLAHIQEAGITRIFNLGDLVGKGPRSAEVVDRCRPVVKSPSAVIGPGASGLSRFPARQLRLHAQWP
ncbi:hypothetical protein N8A98_16785 [Devosia neptuniae]|uniref:Calcineurin-like phosphoesterase domain-containing protein n=1 Tax=Devosia neptuniae TaxID=191302 RepID=A0ABY6CQ98_9HYPH|nr:hypothetical protein N8A98_16785 [Devosia neptuniae]